MSVISETSSREEQSTKVMIFPVNICNSKHFSTPTQWNFAKINLLGGTAGTTVGAARVAGVQAGDVGVQAEDIRVLEVVVAVIVEAVEVGETSSIVVGDTPDANAPDERRIS